MDSSLAFVSSVKELFLEKIKKGVPYAGSVFDSQTLMPGKMLRSRMAASLMHDDTPVENREILIRACTSTELVHTASLLHDDFIDKGVIRRGAPTLWKITSPSKAVLVGDLLLCEAVDLLFETANGRYVSSFISKVREVCSAEFEQEIIHRGKSLDKDMCFQIARAKTGPFFAFVGLVSGGDDAELSSILEESGYRIGTAYQLYDDLIDIEGDENLIGKTLGTDNNRGKFTLPNIDGFSSDVLREFIKELCLSALEPLEKWPRVRDSLENYLENDIYPLINQTTRNEYTM